MKKINLISELSIEDIKLFSAIGVKVSTSAIEISDESPLYFEETQDGACLEYTIACEESFRAFHFLSLSDNSTTAEQSISLNKGIIQGLLQDIDWRERKLRKKENPVVSIKTETVGDEKISTIGGKETDAEIQILVDKKISNKPETIGGKKTDPKIQILDEEKISTKTKTAGGKKTESERKKEKDLEPVTAKLNVFKAKEATFRQEASKQKNNKQHSKYNEAAQAVKKIGNALDLLISKYTGSNQNLDSFKAATQQMLESTDIKQDIETLASHRGTKLLLLNILSAIITLGGSLIYGAAKGNYSLFPAPTDSNSKLQKVTEAIEKLPKKS